MPSADDPNVRPSLDPFDLLRHDLKSPLTTISGRAQLLSRAVRRSSSLTDEERGQMLEALATIQEEVRTMVSLIDALRRDGVDGPPGSAARDT